MRIAEGVRRASHSIAQALQRFATVEPIYMKSWLTIAATCEFEELVAVAGSAGHFLFWQSRELSSERKPVALSKQMNVSLASRAPAQ
jgi:hypothetical protein